MMQYIKNFVGPEYAGLASYIAMAVAALVVLLILWFLISLFRKPRFASSRRNKQARLAITDAATVDSKRRLVLFRRDDVEHLIMIGGPTDIVIETDIRRKKPVAETQTAQPAALVTPPVAPVPAEAAAPVITATEPKPVNTPSRAPNAAPAVAKVSAALGGITGAATSAVAATASTATSAASTTTSAISTAADKLTDLALPDQKDTSIEDDMNSLLDEITTPRIDVPKKD